MKRTTWIAGSAGLILVCVLAVSCEKKSVESKPKKPGVGARQSGAAQLGVKLKVGAALQAKAKSPAAADTAKQKRQRTSIGKAQLVISSAQPSSFWKEDVDVDDDGMVETSDFLYDAQRGVIYTYREDDFGCADGGIASGGIMEALYAESNKAGKPVGSGWYVVNLNVGQCGAKQSGSYGCKFNADGNPTACGVATIISATGEIDLVATQ